QAVRSLSSVRGSPARGFAQPQRRRYVPVAGERWIGDDLRGRSPRRPQLRPGLQRPTHSCRESAGPPREPRGTPARGLAGAPGNTPAAPAEGTEMILAGAPVDRASSAGESESAPTREWPQRSALLIFAPREDGSLSQS